MKRVLSCADLEPVSLLYTHFIKGRIPVYRLSTGVDVTTDALKPYMKENSIFSVQSNDSYITQGSTHYKPPRISYDEHEVSSVYAYGKGGLLHYDSGDKALSGWLKGEFE